MRVPVRMPIQQVEVGPFVGPRRAVESADPRQMLALGRRLRLFAYGGDVRDENPLSLVFHGNLGDDVAPAVETTMVNYYEPPPEGAMYTTGYSAPAAPSYSPRPIDYAALTELQRVQAPTYGAYPTIPTFPATAPSPASTGTSTNWWQYLPAITGSAAVLAQTVAKIVSPTAAPVAGVTRYTIPATATSPAQVVTYDPATGRITTTPVMPAGAAAGLPSFFQAAPGAPWYQNPMLLLGGGLVALVLIIAVSRR